MTGVLINREILRQIHTERVPCEEESQSDAFTSQRTPKIVNTLPDSRRET